MVTEPVPPPAAKIDNGSDTVPVNVPPVSVIVKLPEIARLPIVIVALKVPVPKFVIVTGPEAVVDAPTDTVAFVTVIVVEVVVAAFATAPARIARAQVFMIAVIVYLLRNTQAGK